MRGNTDIGVNAHSRYGGATWTCEGFKALHVDPIPDGRDPTAGSRPGGDPPTHRSPVEFCEQRLVAAKPVGFFGIGLWPQTSPLEQGNDPARDASCNPGYLGIVGRRQRIEAEAPSLFRSVDTVERQHVEMDVQI